MVAFDGLEVLRTESERLYRQVIRIMLMVPLYAIASFISLFSLEAAFFIDAVRDIYEVRPPGRGSPLSSSCPGETDLPLVGVCNLLFLRSPHCIPWRREVPTDSLAWTTAEVPRLSWEPGVEGGGCERPVYVLVSQTRRYP